MCVQGGAQKPVDRALSFYPRGTDVREVRGLCKDTQLVSGQAGPRTEKPCLLVRCSFRHTMLLLTFTASLSLNLLTRAKQVFPNRNLIISRCAFIHAISSAWNTLPPPASLSGECLPCVHFQLEGLCAVKASLPCLVRLLINPPLCCGYICLFPLPARLWLPPLPRTSPPPIVSGT